MDSCIQNFTFLFVSFLLTFPLVGYSQPLNSNFIHLSSSQSSYVGYKVQQDKNSFRHGSYLNGSESRILEEGCAPVFSFYASQMSIAPKIVAKKNNQVFLLSSNQKLLPLGILLPLQNEILMRMQNTVAEGRLLLGFQNKEHKEVAFVQDNRGMVYSVTRLAKQHYTIQTLGILTSNQI